MRPRIRGGPRAALADVRHEDEWVRGRSEIADAIAFITSEQAGFLTGQTIFLDGGVMAL